MYWSILRRVTTCKRYYFNIRMIIKRTFQNHNGLIFNDLRAFIGGGGGKNGQGIVWCKHLISEKKFFEKRKKKKENFEKRF